MTKFVPNKKHSRTALIFCFHLKKTTAESYRLLGEAYGEHAPSQKTCDGFSVSKLEISILQTRNTENRPKKYEDVELQALLDENDSQTQKQLLAEQLSVSQQAVSNRLREMGKIQKVGRWMPHELNERDREAQKHM